MKDHEVILFDLIKEELAMLLPEPDSIKKSLDCAEKINKHMFHSQTYEVRISKIRGNLASCINRAAGEIESVKKEVEDLLHSMSERWQYAMKNLTPASKEKCNITQRSDTTYYIITQGAITEMFREEFSEAQMAEIRAVMLVEYDRHKMLHQLTEKIKSFGEEVSSHIVARLVSHPVIAAGLDLQKHW
jgi:hypothetical protein